MFKRILVPIDGTRTAESGLSTAIRMARDERAELARKMRADAIVIGTHGRRGISRMVLGSDAEEVVRRSPVPVLLVRSGTLGRK